MHVNEDPIELPGSERAAAPGANRAGTVDRNEEIEVILLLRPRCTDAPLPIKAAIGADSLAERRYMTRAAFATAYAPDPEAIRRTRHFAAKHGLRVVNTSIALRTVTLRGTVRAMSAAFKVELEQYEKDGDRFRGRIGPVHLPRHLVPFVAGVFGLDDRPQSQPNLAAELAPLAMSAPEALTPPEVAKFYNFPPDLTGKGQCIGIIEFGGGFLAADIETYFNDVLHLSPPEIVVVPVAGGANRPTNAGDKNDREVALDIDVAAGVAPDARIVVYFAPDTSPGWLLAIRKAVHDDVNRPSILSISWGAPEIRNSAWTPQLWNAINDTFKEAATLGVTVFCATGDNGACDGVSTQVAHVDFPASSPYATACGGTQLADGDPPHEVVWNNIANGCTGGGISDLFCLPDYQANAAVPKSANPGGRIGRGVPDVAGIADSLAAFTIRVDGTLMAYAGTSAVAPLWAGLTALLNEGLPKPVGFFNPLLYGLANTAGAFNDITDGTNGMYEAGAGWDACTGLGSPNGVKLLDALK